MKPLRIFWLFCVFAAIMIVIGFAEPPLWQLFELLMLGGVGTLVFVTASKGAATDRTRMYEYARLQSIISELRDGIMVYDDHFTILEFNKAAEEILGISAKEVLGKSFPLTVKDEVKPQYRLLLMILFPALAPTVIRRSDPSGYPHVSDFTFADPLLELRVTTTEMKDEAGNSVGLMKIIHNQTREISILRSKNEFITIASHQLRTPLTGINWAWETLEHENLTEAQRTIVVTGKQSTQHLLDQVEDLLDVAKIEEGRFGYEFAAVDIVPVVQETIASAQPAADSRKIKLYFTAPHEALPPITADREKISIALSNLIENAIKYNVEGGEVRVGIERVPMKPYIKISVQDTGIGISSDAQGKLFKKFFREESARRLEPSGTGLGLYITKNIVRRHGGTLSVESSERRGSIFSFTLPTNPQLIPPKEIAYEEE